MRLLICALVLSVAGCQTKSSDTRLIATDQEEVIASILRHREMVDSSFRYDKDSPFQRDTSIHFDGIKWFPPDTAYRTESILFRNENPETVLIYGTKGDERKQLTYGYFLVTLQRKKIRLNVYKDASRYQSGTIVSDHHLSVWFTDETTGKETYGVGRYLDVGRESKDRTKLYILDFNRAYNPYCAYSPLYSCAIPRREDYLPIAIKAGELKYHP